MVWLGCRIGFFHERCFAFLQLGSSRKRKDFVSAITKKVREREMNETFNIITISNHLANKYNNFKDIYKLHKKVRGHIYIFGEPKKRQHGSDRYFLSVDG